MNGVPSDFSTTGNVLQIYMNLIEVDGVVNTNCYFIPVNFDDPSEPPPYNVPGCFNIYTQMTEYNDSTNALAARCN